MEALNDSKNILVSGNRAGASERYPELTPAVPSWDTAESRTLDGHVLGVLEITQLPGAETSRSSKGRENFSQPERS